MVSRRPADTRWTCARKRRYDTEREAERGAQAMAARHGEQFNAYGCGACGGWHVGRDARRHSRADERGINALRSALLEFYPTVAEQDAWLDAPHPLLGGSAAGDLVGTDREDEVWALVDQLRSGAVV